MDNIDTVYNNILALGYQLPSSVVKSLLSSKPTPLPSATSPPTSASPQCRSSLYSPSSPLSTLNTPLYIATDHKFPLKDPPLDLFRNTFPCLFFLGDFKLLGDVKGLLEEAKDEEGVKLGPFLEPFVEAEVLAKGKRVIGSELFLVLVS